MMMPQDAQGFSSAELSLHSHSLHFRSKHAPCVWQGDRRLEDALHSPQIISKAGHLGVQPHKLILAQVAALIEKLPHHPEAVVGPVFCAHESVQILLSQNALQQPEGVIMAWDMAYGPHSEAGGRRKLLPGRMQSC